MTISPIDVHIREDIGGKYMEFFTYKELPFSVRESLMGPLERNGETHHGQWRVVPEDSKAVHDHGGLHQGAVLEHCSGRRPRQASCPTLRRIDRDIIIWVARLTPTEIKHKLLHGLTYNLRGQVVIKRSSRSTPEQEYFMLHQGITSD
ncbi:hypothetical protein F442_14263 [Phytophthora nicotianae P10297]|uniref:Uncharacterized protein n=1 Tax=Phytophthora nicotianae P10297 TaxID=1317064 RepID=W2YSS1_PHYNI|nr:hypothetical protein F442_14263 [Phytophthora nicotianae P10297]